MNSAIQITATAKPPLSVKKSSPSKDEKAAGEEMQSSGKSIEKIFDDALEGSRVLRVRQLEVLDQFQNIAKQDDDWVKQTIAFHETEWRKTSQQLQALSDVRLQALRNLLDSSPVLSHAEMMAMTDAEYTDHMNRKEADFRGKNANFKEISKETAELSDLAFKENKNTTVARAGAGESYFSEQGKRIMQAQKQLEYISKSVDNQLQAKAELIKKALEAYEASARTLADLEESRNESDQKSRQQAHEHSLERAKESNRVSIENRRLDLEERKDQREFQHKALAERTIADIEKMKIELEGKKCEADRRIVINRYYNRWWGWWRPCL